METSALAQFELVEMFLSIRLAFLLRLFFFCAGGVHITHHKTAPRLSMLTAGFYLLSKSEITTVL